MKRISLLIPLAVSGCIAYPGVTAAKCELQIQRVGQEFGNRAIVDSENNYIVFKYWYSEATNDTPAHIELLDVSMTNSEKIVLSYPARMYAIFWTPALGTQHLHPIPAVMVFANGCMPVFVNTVWMRDFCCAPPNSGVQIMTAVLHPEVPDNEEGDNKNYWEYKQLAALSRILCRLDEIMRLRQIEHPEKTMIYQQLLNRAQLLSRLQISAQSDRSKSSLQRLTDSLRLRLE